MPKAIDLSGQRFGRLLAVERRAGSSKEAASWLCVCDCGNEKFVVTELLRNGHVKSCGCLHRDQLSERRSIKEKEGSRYGKLVIVGPAGRGGSHGHYLMWQCKCDCGNEVIVEGKRLRDGSKRSCGCLISESITAAHAQDITGQRFGRLVAIKPIIGAKYPNGRAKRQWEFKCDCGKKTVSTVSMVK